MWILVLGTRFQLLDYVNTEEARVCLCTSVWKRWRCEKSSMCVAECTGERVSSCIYKRMWRAAG